MAESLTKKQRCDLEDGPCVGRPADDEHYEYGVIYTFEGVSVACHYYWGCTSKEVFDFWSHGAGWLKTVRRSAPASSLEHRCELREVDHRNFICQYRPELGIVFEFRSTTAFVANMQVDTALRQSVVTELKKLRFHCVIVPAGFCAESVVCSVREDAFAGVCELGLTEEGQAMMSKSRISIKTNQPARSVSAFGCAMTHRNLLLAVAHHRTNFKDGMDSYAAIFADDIYVPRSAEYTKLIVETCVGRALAGLTVPDIIYLFAWNPECEEPLTVFAEMNNPMQAHYKPMQEYPDKILLVKTKCAYGCQGFLIKRSAAKIVLRYLEPEHVMFQSDGAIRRACTSGELVAAHFVSLPAHSSSVKVEPNVCDLNKFQVVDPTAYRIQPV